MFFVYILYSNKLSKFYTGYTESIEKRLAQHNSQSVPFTSKGTPWHLVYYSAFDNKSDAIAEEKFLKTGKGRERRSYLLKNFMESL